MARHIEDWLYFSVYTSQEEIDLMLRGRLAKARMQLLTFRIILLIVSMVILTLVIYTFTMEKIRSIAIMKLMGAANWVIIRLVLEQSLLLTLSSFLFGWLIIHNTQDFFPRKIFLTPFDESSPLAWPCWEAWSPAGWVSGRPLRPNRRWPWGALMEALKISGLSKIFGSGRLKVRALEDSA